MILKFVNYFSGFFVVMSWFW